MLYLLWCNDEHFPWRCADNSVVLLMTFSQLVLSSEGSHLSAGNPLRLSVCEGGLFP